MNWSKYQQDVFDFQNQPGHCFVNAGPGSGKTTLIEEMVRRTKDHDSVLVVAFNVHIKEELKKRLSHLRHVTVDSLNGFGNKIVRANVSGYIKVDKDKMMNILFFEFFKGKDASDEDKKLYYSIRHPVCKLVSLCKAKMLWKPDDDQLVGLAMEYDIRLPDDFYKMLDYAKQLLDFGFTRKNKIDFDDQISMPILFDWSVPSYDKVFVDESQDLNPVQIELTVRAIAPGGKATYVGDPRQAIYQFRGADKHAVESVVQRLGCSVFPLPVCYRCSKAVIAEAAKIDSNIFPREDAPDGAVRTISTTDYRLQITRGDRILCRTGAPLIRECYRLIAAGVGATVKGREIEDDLLNVVPENNMDVVDFLDQISTEYQPRIAKMQALNKHQAAINLQDTLDCLYALAERCSTTTDMRKLIKVMFKTDEDGIVLMTCHKSKGLEARRIYIIRPDLLPHPKGDPEVEENVRWVAITRAQEELYYVEPEKE